MTSDVAGLLAALTPAADRHVDFKAWRATWRAGPDAFADAIRAGLVAGNLAMAFAGAYQAALRRLLPGHLAPDQFAALLLSEGRRQRPEELTTRLVPSADGFFLDGEKSFVTGGADADVLLVIARRDGADGAATVSTGLVMVAKNTVGVSLEARTDMPVLRELPHARAHFAAVPVLAGQIISGDGWRDFGRPFRTLEDIFVSVAMAAYLFACGRERGWPPSLLATLFSCMQRLADMAAADVHDPRALILLAGAEHELATAAAQVDALFAAEQGVVAADWQANRILLSMAAPQRARRLERALQAVFPEKPPRG